LKMAIFIRRKRPGNVREQSSWGKNGGKIRSVIVAYGIPGKQRRRAAHNPINDQLLDERRTIQEKKGTPVGTKGDNGATLTSKIIHEAGKSGMNLRRGEVLCESEDDPQDQRGG